jgi:DNA-binding NarL/FixJ family response regulator
MAFPRVLIADDHEAVARHLTSLLSDKFEILGSVSDGSLVLEAAVTLRPDIVLLDLSLPHVHGLEVLRRLKRAHPDFRVIIVTMFADPTVAQEAIRHGASGFVLKSDLGCELLTAVKAVLSGQCYIAPSLREDVEESTCGVADPASVALTTQQRHVLTLLVRGQRTREIASLLDMPTSRVTAIKEGMMRRVGVQSTADLVQYTIEHDLLV